MPYKTLQAGKWGEEKLAEGGKCLNEIIFP